MCVLGPQLPLDRDLRAEAVGRTGRGGQPPESRNFICFEPMVGITDAMNLAQKGLYKELQSIPPGGTLAGELLGSAERILTES